MAAWVDDIVQALMNLGGQATLNQIYIEIRRIRTNLPDSTEAIIRGRLEYYSSDSEVFHKMNLKGENYFRKVGKGTWALRSSEQIDISKPIKKTQVRRRKAPHTIVSLEEPHALADSFETIVNTFRTIKEYREYNDPNVDSWQNYVREIFHLHGFNTEEWGKRLFVLKNLGSSHNLALVVYIRPSEDFQYIVSDLSWQSYLQYAANFHRIERGILTNGLRIKIIDIPNSSTSKPILEVDLDDIIKTDKNESYFSLYKVFSYIKNRSNLTVVKPRSEKRKENITVLPKTLSNILDVYLEMTKNDCNYPQAYQTVTKRNNLLSIHTVPDACTRRIGLNTAGFLELCSNKDKLIQHLKSYFPDHSEKIQSILTSINK